VRKAIAESQIPPFKAVTRSVLPWRDAQSRGSWCQYWHPTCSACLMPETSCRGTGCVVGDKACDVPRL